MTTTPLERFRDYVKGKTLDALKRDVPATAPGVDPDIANAMFQMMFQKMKTDFTGLAWVSRPLVTYVTLGSVGRSSSIAFTAVLIEVERGKTYALSGMVF